MACLLPAGLALASAAGPAQAQADGEGLLIRFAPGSAAVDPAERGKLDEAARLYRDGNPIVMVVTGAADRTGPADVNLRLSVARAESVIRGLVDRGIPIDRLQLAAKGETEPATPTEDGVAEARNRVVEVNWR